MKNLSENSPSYYDRASVYEDFCAAQDSPQLVAQYLIPAVSRQSVVDMGCGNGKYSAILSPYAQSLLSCDKSEQQLRLARSKYPQLHLFCTDITSIALRSHSFDIALCSWVLGTLTRERQLLALKELKRVAHKIILIENDIDSEFETLRQRHSSIDTRTSEYNAFLLTQGFRVSAQLSTYFQFSSTQCAQQTFSRIWGEHLEQHIKKDTIEQKIVIFEWSSSV